MRQLTDVDFEKEVLKAEGLVVVDFWAPWCGPCKMMEPVVDFLVSEFNDKPVKIMKFNIDENNQTASQYGVMSIPTFLFFKNGQVVDQVVGGVSLDALKAKVEGNLG